jgi:hypothetical protein
MLPQIYPSNPNIPHWISTHWNNGKKYKIQGRDKNDPTGLSQKRGTGKLLVKGNGILEMSGSQPRIYINGDLDGDGISEAIFYKNTEITVYYRQKSSPADWGGLIIGCRSSPNGHSSPSSNYKNTTTYYARFRGDGKVDFEKELTHSPTEYQWNGKLHTHGHIFDGPFPNNIWIGMKFICYTQKNGNVKLELYIDRTSQGNEEKIKDISVWEKLGEAIDAGDWPAPIISKYKNQINPYTIIKEGNGVPFIRNTDISKGEYKYFEVREIQVEEEKEENPIQNILTNMHIENLPITDKNQIDDIISAIKKVIDINNIDYLLSYSK